MQHVIRHLSGTFQKDRYIPWSSGDRAEYINTLYSIAESEDYSFFQEINEPYLKHTDREFTINFYFRDWVRIIPILKRFYGEGIFLVVNGFRSPFEQDANVHTLGLAMDISVKDSEDAERLMSAAYMTGIPTILPVGDIAAGQGHIHLDLAPKPNYTYDAGDYTGPWSDVY